MSPRTVEQVDDWSTVPFAGGYGGLRDLATSDFSGVVTAGPARLFMLRGSVVGVLDGSIDDFEDSDGTAREAPHPALPLLAVMQERSDEVRAKYYTEETPLEDVDATLADGGFTGYVELAENVLSGDYYQVYHQGRSMSVAYVGSSQRLITDDDAFEQANGEVGIFEVRPVDIEVIDIPEDETEAVGGGSDDEPLDRTASPTDRRDDATTAPTDEVSDDDPMPDRSVTGGDAVTSKVADTGGRSGSERPTDSPGRANEDTHTQSARDGRRESTRDRSDDTGTDVRTEDRSTDDSRTSDARSTDATDDVVEEPEAGAETAARTDSTPTESPGPAGGSENSQPRTDAARSSRAESAAETETDASASSRSRSGSPQEPSTSGPADAGTAETEPSDAGPRAGSGDGSAGAAGSAGSAADLETRSIPSLDPARTGASSKPTPPDPPVTPDAPAEDASAGQSPSTPSSSSPEPSDTEPSGSPEGRDRSSAGGTTESRDPEPAGGASDERVEELESELRERRRELEDLESTLSTVEGERDDLRRERDALAEERDDLRAQLEDARAEIERLESRLESAAGDDPTAGAETRLSSREAIEQTNLFVRYRSKGDATLESAHTGEADRSAVEENLRLEYHTQFDADSAAVGDETFDTFLTGTIQYRFVDWLVGQLLYEIRETGHEGAMQSLYDALPKIDRAELNGQVSVEYTENGETHRAQEQFDVVVRDRMGNPLVVANINNSRDPATDSMMTDLVKRAERVGQSSDSLAGAFLVTESFFEPGALETAEEATSSGLFSRDKRKSFVNLSRKDGYHLCLLEARNQEFHLAVPEL